MGSETAPAETDDAYSKFITHKNHAVHMCNEYSNIITSTNRAE